MRRKQKTTNNPAKADKNRFLKYKENKRNKEDKEIRDGCGTEEDDRKHCLIREGKTNDR